MVDARHVLRDADLLTAMFRHFLAQRIAAILIQLHREMPGDEEASFGLGHSVFSHRCFGARLWAGGRWRLIRVQLPSLLIVVGVHPAAL